MPETSIQLSARKRRTMTATVTITESHVIDHKPLTCSECFFADLCDGRIANLSKRGGMQWTKAALTKRAKNCPMVITES